MLIQTSGFSTGFANGHYKYTSVLSSASVGLQWIFDLVCDDPRNTVPMTPPSLILITLLQKEKTKESVGKIILEMLYIK